MINWKVNLPYAVIHSALVSAAREPKHESWIQPERRPAMVFLPLIPNDLI